MRLLPLEELRSDDTSDPQVEALPSDLTMLIYTGGTTGPSKGCMISHNNACNEARQLLLAHGRTRESITWTSLPLFHLNATVTTVLLNLMIGARAVIYPRFSVSGFWPDIERSGECRSVAPRRSQATGIRRCTFHITGESYMGGLGHVEKPSLSIDTTEFRQGWRAPLLLVSVLHARTDSYHRTLAVCTLGGGAP